MSPESPSWYQWYHCFPRVSGDEPFCRGDAEETGEFSPRERG